MRKRITSLVLIPIAVVCVVSLWSPVYSLCYRAIHGKTAQVAGHRITLPSWYIPVGKTTLKEMYFAADSPIPRRSRVIGVMQAGEMTATYESVKEGVLNAVRANSVSKELQLQTPAGAAKCFEVVLTRGVEANCVWETGQLRAVYTGPAGNVSDLYELAQSAIVVR